MLHEKLDQRDAFLIGHAVETLHMTTDIQRLAAGLGMRANQRMDAGGLHVPGLLDLHVRHRVVAGPRDRPSVLAEIIADADRAELTDSAFMPSDRLSYARYWLVNIVSPPADGTSSAYRIVPIAGYGENIWSVCHEPPKFFLSAGVLMISRISGWSGHSLHERMQMDLAPAPGEAQLLLGRQRLVAEEDHAVVEQRCPDLRQHVVRQVLGQVDARHLGAE